MVFKPKFFLELDGGGDQKPKAAEAAATPVSAKPQATSIEAPKPAARKAGLPWFGRKAADQTPAAASKAATIPAAAPPAVAGPAAATLTTAEAIAAELAAAEAKRPAASLATFAPQCLVPGGANPIKRRSGGANLGPFKEMAKGMMGR